MEIFAVLPPASHYKPFIGSIESRDGIKQGVGGEGVRERGCGCVCVRVHREVEKTLKHFKKVEQMLTLWRNTDV